MVPFADIVEFIRSVYKTDKFIPLHAPLFAGREKEYLAETIDSTFVSSVGPFVNQFEKIMTEITGAKYAVATVNGTSALHIALVLANVKPGDEVLTQPLTFVATANAISYLYANAVFIDVERDTMGMSPGSLSSFLEKNAVVKADGFCYNKNTGNKITACVPMHTFGFPCRIDEIKEICDKWHIILIEDAAESMGSTYKNKHTGTFGKIGVFSLNGNKIITCGGGGAVVTDDADIAAKAKHLTTQAKVAHAWEFFHDEVGYNYRMPNVNAALACAQLEQLAGFLESKRKLAKAYEVFFKKTGIDFITEITDAKANYWLNCILLSNKNDRDGFLAYSNENKVMTRPAWTLMHRLPMFKNCIVADSLSNAEFIEERLVNIPSSVVLEK